MVMDINSNNDSIVIVKITSLLIKTYMTMVIPQYYEKHSNAINNHKIRAKRQDSKANKW